MELSSGTSQQCEVQLIGQAGEAAGREQQGMGTIKRLRTGDTAGGW